MTNNQEFLSTYRFDIPNHSKLSPCNPGGPCSGNCAPAASMPHYAVSVIAAQQYIEQLDLDYIIKTMCSPTYRLGQWAVADAVYCAQLYKKYLLLLKKHLPENLVPSRAIDEFWHNHILYTKNYLRDCLAIFGHYLHHEPGPVDEVDPQLADGYLKTKQLYLVEFGITL